MKNSKRVYEYWNEKPWGTREFFEEQEYKKYFIESHIPKFAEFEKWKGKKVLEIGCGMGSDTVNFARAGAWVASVDLTPRSLELTQKRLEVYGLSDRVKLYEANAEELSSVVPVETFDLIYSFGVIHHSPNPANILEQMRLYADKNTILKIMVYYFWSFNTFYRVIKDHNSIMAWVFKKNQLVLNSESIKGCPVTYLYSKKKLFNMLREHGFSPMETWISFLVDYDYIPSQFRSFFNSIPKFVIKFLEQYFGWNLCVTARLDYKNK